MSNSREQQKLEEMLLNSSIPEDENVMRGSAASDMGRKIAKKTKENPKMALYIIGGIAVTFIIFLLFFKIIGILNSGSSNNLPADSQQQPTPALEGFNYLATEQREGLEEKGEVFSETAALPEEEVLYEENAAEQEVVAQEPAAAEESTQATITSYYPHPSITSALPQDSLVQIGDMVYKLPLSMRELEENGIVLVTLGSQPPSEDAMLYPQMRNGYIQYNNKRYFVTLKNGMECTYHDLQVCQIGSNDESADMYIFGEITIGSEEASIPQGADKITEDMMGVNTFYCWGTLDRQLYNTSGRYTEIVVNNQSGKVTEISVFNDATQ